MSKNRWKDEYIVIQYTMELYSAIESSEWLQNNIDESHRYI